MKKILLLFLFVLGVFSFCYAIDDEEVSFVLKGGVNLPSEVKLVVKNYGSNKADTEIGFNVCLEMTFPISEESLYFGMGGGYVSELKVKGYDESKGVSWVPVYALLKLKPHENVYFIGQLGYGIGIFDEEKNPVDDKVGGIYYGIGGGLEFEKMIIELLYSYTEANFQDGKIKMEYPKVSLNAGVKF